MMTAVSLRVLIAEPDDFSHKAVDLLRRRATVDLRRVDTTELAAALERYDVLWIRLGHRIDAAMASRATRCRIIATATTGLDHIDLDACAAHDVQVISLRGENEFLREVRATAELTVLLALALVRKLPAATASVLQGAWDRDRFRGTELYRKTAGIVGVGRLGRIVGGYFAALGMEVVGFDAGPFEDPVIAPVDALEDVLERADFLSLHVPLRASTHHLIGARQLKRMKPSSVLINTSRGQVVDDAALLDALQRGAIAGAALDVLASEPDVGRDHPLVRYAETHDNLIITPHIGGNTHESFEKTEVFLARKVLRALEERT